MKTVAPNPSPTNCLIDLAWLVSPNSCMFGSTWTLTTVSAPRIRKASRLITGRSIGIGGRRRAQVAVASAMSTTPSRWDSVRATPASRAQPTSGMEMTKSATLVVTS